MRQSLAKQARGFRSAVIGGDPGNELGLFAKLVVALALMLTIAGIVWHGITGDTLARLWRQIIERPSGPLAFRFILQPAMAAIAAIRDGWRDAQCGRSPFLWTIVSNPRARGARLREGVNATVRIFCLGLVMDAAYQALVLKAFYPNEAVIVALVLAFLPYLAIRGVVRRVAAIGIAVRSRFNRDGAA